MIKILIWGSVINYFLGGPDHVFGVAFLIEYLWRWYDDVTDPDREVDYGISGDTHYPLSIFGIIDLLSWLPYFVWLFTGYGAGLQIIRLLKYFRYSRHLQLVALGFYRASNQLLSMGFMLIIISLFSTAIMYELEHEAQPEAFGNILNVFWFTIVSETTVGYGDISPVTPMGKIAAIIILFLPALSIYAGMIGILGGSFSHVLEEEDDPNVDPIKEFKKEYMRKHGFGIGKKKICEDGECSI